MLCRCVALADVLPPPSLVRVLFGRMLCRRYWLVGWMFCHLVCVADLRIFGDVALLQVQLLVGAAPVLVRFVGLEVFSSVVLLLLCLFWFLGVCLCFFQFFSVFSPL